MEEYFFDAQKEDEIGGERKIFTLIIYNIIDDEVRMKFAKHLQEYGFYVGKASLGAMIPRRKYEKLLREIPGFMSEKDSVCIYRLSGQCNLIKYGRNDGVNPESAEKYSERVL